ncbi:hypothetical protein D3C84_602540 [compost metagenome]
MLGDTKLSSTDFLLRLVERKSTKVGVKVIVVKLKELAPVRDKLLETLLAIGEGAQKFDERCSKN